MLLGDAVALVHEPAYNQMKKQNRMSQFVIKWNRTKNFLPSPEASATEQNGIFHGHNNDGPCIPDHRRMASVAFVFPSSGETVTADSSRRIGGFMCGSTVGRRTRQAAAVGQCHARMGKLSRQRADAGGAGLGDRVALVSSEVGASV